MLIIESFDLNQLKKLLDEAQGDGPVFIGDQSLIEAYNDDLIERAEEDEDSTESDSVNS
jgi:Tfp pilus assembly ATPase PilU